MEINGTNRKNRVNRVNKINKINKVMRININKNCVGCGHCVPFCPTDAITVYAMASISEEKCTSCSRCISYCPTDAIYGVNK